MLVTLFGMSKRSSLLKQAINHFISRSYNAFPSTLKNLELQIMEVIPLPAIGFPKMLVTLSGMTMDFRDLQSLKAEFPILVTLSGMIMDFRDLHSVKAEFPMLVTLSGMIMDFRDLHSVKAEFPMLVTLSGMTMD